MNPSGPVVLRQNADANFHRQYPIGQREDAGNASGGIINNWQRGLKPTTVRSDIDLYIFLIKTRFKSSRRFPSQSDIRVAHKNQWRDDLREEYTPYVPPSRFISTCFKKSVPIPCL